MPFTSKAQMRLCYKKQRDAVQAGETPTWNCSEMYHGGEGTNYGQLPYHVRGSSQRRTKSTTTNKTKATRKLRGKVHIGPRGGHYRMLEGHKVYVK